MNTTQHISLYYKLTELIIKMENFDENLVEESVEKILNKKFKDVEIIDGEDCNVLRREFLNR